MERERPVVWIVECACGYKVEEPTQEEAARQVQRHGKAVHSMDLDWEQALALARPT